MPLTTAELAQRKKFLVDAILWKKNHPSAQFYQDIYSYNDFILRQSLRFLPRDYTKHLQYAVNELGETTGGFTDESITKFVDEIYRNRESHTIRELLDPATTPLEPEKAVEEFEQAKADQEKEAEERKEKKKEEPKPERSPEPEHSEPEQETPKEEKAEAETSPSEEPSSTLTQNTVTALPGLENTRPVAPEPPALETGGTTGPTSQPLHDNSGAWIENLDRRPVSIRPSEDAAEESIRGENGPDVTKNQADRPSKKLEEQVREVVNTPAEPQDQLEQSQPSQEPVKAPEPSSPILTDETLGPEPSSSPEPLDDQTESQRSRGGVAVLERPAPEEPQVQEAPKTKVAAKEELAPLPLTPPIGETGGTAAPPSKAALEADRIMWMANLEPTPKPTPATTKTSPELAPTTPPKPKFVMIGSHVFEPKPAKPQPEGKPTSFTKREIERLNQVAKTNKEILERKPEEQPTQTAAPVSKPKPIPAPAPTPIPAPEPIPVTRLERRTGLPKAAAFMKRLPVPSPVKTAGNNLLIAVHNVMHRVPAAISAATTGGIGLGLIAGGLPGGAVGGLMGYVISSHLVRDTSVVITTEESYEEHEPVYYHPSVTSDGAAMQRRNSLGRSLVRQGAKRLAKQGAKKLASSLAKKLAAEGLKEGVTALAAATSEVWVPVLIIIAIILFLLIFGPKLASLISLCPPDSANPFLQPMISVDSSGNVTVKKPQVFNHCGAPIGGGGGNAGTTPTSTIDIEKTGPKVVDNGQDIPYQIKVTNNGVAPVDIDITDPIPNNTEFVDASDLAGNVSGVITWHVTGIAPGASRTVTMTVKPLVNDTYITNQASATISAGGGSGSGTNTGGNTGTGGTNQGGNSGGNTAANNDNCGGKYSLNNPIGNFGDPNCNFNKSDLFQAFQQADPTNAEYWFNVVIPCESGYNPDSYNPNSTDGDGAFGLTQMGRGQNGQYDHGDVNWPLQASNSVNYQHQITGWTYWACAIDRW